MRGNQIILKRLEGKVRAETAHPLHDAFAKVVMDPIVQERLSVLNFTTDVKGSTEGTAVIKAELTRWKRIIQENNVTSQD